MVDFITQDQIIQWIIFQGIMLLIALSNIFILHHARRHAPLQNFPTISIMVPARNEEKNIEKCIQSLLAQEYPSFEVLVLDDQSVDCTRLILEKIASTQPGLKILVGSLPANGQGGKNWACAQLAHHAQGDLLFFTDADTQHHPAALRHIVAAMLGEQADLITGFPHQEMATWGERLLVPFFAWASLCFNPLWVSYRVRLPALSSAVGQMMLFRREAYERIGGHAGIDLEIVDDLKLARNIKTAGLRWRMVNVSDLITCRMYRGSREAVDGFTKNLFAAFSFRLLPFLFVFTWLLVLFWLPLISLAWRAIGMVPGARLDLLITCIGLSLIVWIVPYLELRIPAGLALLYPVTILANVGVAYRSLIFSLVGRLRWKGRSLARPKWKWL